MIPLTIIHCWGKSLCKRLAKRDDTADIIPTTPHDSNREYPIGTRDTISNHDNIHPDRGGVNTTPTIGVYNVTSGAVIHPATVNPSTLRSFSTSHNSFKPFSYTNSHPISLFPWTKP